MTPKGTRTRARRGEGDRLRVEILDAAEELLRREGDQDAVSIRAIASSVGCTAPSIYRHFHDKSELMFAVCQRHFDQLQAEMAERIGTLTDPLDVLRAIGEAYLEFGLAHPEQYRIMFMIPGSVPEGDGFLDQVLGEDTTFGLLVRAISDAIDAGLIAADDPFMLAVEFWTMAHGVTSIAVAGSTYFPYPDPRLVFDRLTEKALRALAP